MVRKKGIQLLSLFISILFLVLSVVPKAFADEVEYAQQTTFWHWLSKQGKENGILNGIIAYGLGAVCSNSPDGYHHATSSFFDGELWREGQYRCICDYCHKEFWAVESDIKQS